MQDRERLQEIEEIGEQEENEEELQNESVRSGHSIVPLVQTAVCVLILLALLFLKYTDQERYQSVTGFYQKAAEEEAARVAAEQAAQEKEQVADSNTSIKGNTTAKSNKSSNTGIKGNGSSSGKGSSNNEANSTSTADDDNPIPGLTPGQSWDVGEPAETITCLLYTSPSPRD